MKKLYLSDHDKKICGVLGGIAEYFEIDSTLVRLAYILVSLFTAGFPGIFVYILACFIIPKNQI